MKKIALSLFAAGMLATAAKAQVSVAPEAGLNVAGFSVKPTLSNGETKSPRVGFMGGINVNLGLGDHFYLQPGLFYFMTGSKFSYSEAGVTSTQKYNINTLELPINIQYKLAIGNTGNLIVGVGPYIAYNMSGKIMIDPNYLGSGSSDIHFGSSDDDDMKRIDFGIGVNGGYMFNDVFFIRARYQFGIPNLVSHPQNDEALRMHSFSVSVGYNFGGGK